MRLDKKTKSKSVYLAATENGLYPTTPKTKPEYVQKDLEFSKRFKPAEKWRIFKLTQSCIFENYKEVKLPITAEISQSSIAETLIYHVLDRHEARLKSLGVEKVPTACIP